MRHKRGAGHCSSSSSSSSRQHGLGRLKKNIGLIKVLADGSQPLKLRKAIATNAPPALVGSVSDCCRNVLNGRIKLSPTKKRQLSTHRKAIRLLANPKVGAGRKRKVIAKQKGGFLVPLLAAAIPSAIQLIASHFSKKKQSGSGRRRK
jgi:hypothetical protein